MTTTANWIADTRRLLQATSRDEINTLDAAIADTTSDSFTLTLALGGIAKGALLSIDLETLYVLSVAASTPTVIRGFASTTPAVHDPGTAVYVNPRYTDYEIFKALNDEIGALSSPSNGLFHIPAPYNFTYTAAIDTYNLTLAGFIDVLDVRWSDIGPSHNWIPVRTFTVERDADPTAFPGGVALRLFESIMPGRTVHVTYKAEFTALAALTSDVTTTNLPATAWDIPPLGAAARLLASREARRSSFDAAPESRKATEVPPGTAGAAGRGLTMMRNQRIKEEAARLSARHPTMRRRA